MNIDTARRAAAELLRQTTGESLPEWRPVFDVHETGAVAEPDGIAPVCPDPDHERVDGNVYDCCPEPVIVVDPPLAEYLAALLNADRAQNGDAPQQQDGPRTFNLVGHVEAIDRDEAEWAAEQGASGMRGAGYSCFLSVEPDTAAGGAE